MTVNIIPHGINSIYNYVKFILGNDEKYTEEDREWLGYLILSISEYIDMNIYYLLTIINVKCFSGYFSRIFNAKLCDLVKERNTDETINHLSKLEFPEIYDNKYLSEEESNMLKNLFDLDILATNLTIKRFCFNNYLYENISKAYEDSYNIIYMNMYASKVGNPKASFEDFIIITKENENTKIKYAYTFNLLDVLLQYVYDKFTFDIGEENIEMVKSSYSTELKMVRYYVENINS